MLTERLINKYVEIHEGCVVLRENDGWMLIVCADDGNPPLGDGVLGGYAERLKDILGSFADELLTETGHWG